jgi:hypothetical protein
MTEKVSSVRGTWRMNGAGFMRRKARRCAAKYLYANVKPGTRIVKRAAAPRPVVNLFRPPPTNGYRNLLTQERAMSRKIILSLAAIATLAGAALMSNNADAMVRGGNGGHGGHAILRPVGHVGHIGRIDHQIGHRNWRFHDHRHFVRWHRHIWIRPVGYAVRDLEIGTVQPGPCTCLTKNYTPEGLVVFQDLCTKEMASAPVDGSSDQAAAAQAPASYAGKTYQDYLKANPQAAPETKQN